MPRFLLKGPALPVPKKLAAARGGSGITAEYFCVFSDALSNSGAFFKTYLPKAAVGMRDC